MIIYADKFSNITFSLLDQIFPEKVQQHMLEIMDANPSAYFYCRIDKQEPNVHIYLIEQDDPEGYTLCHFLLYDQIGEDYTYQCLSAEHIQASSRLISQLSISD